MAKILNLLPWRRRRLEEDLSRELRYHVERRVDDLRRSGLSDADARRQAAIELGGVTQVQEEVRDTWIWRWLDDRGRDLRYAGRTLLRTPGFTATALLSLALGIGANAAVFSLVDQVLLRRLPVAEPERLVHLDWSGNSLSTAQWGTGNRMSYPLCRELQEQRHVFDGVFCRYPTGVNLATGQEHEPVDAAIVSGSYFPVLGVPPTDIEIVGVIEDLSYISLRQTETEHVFLPFWDRQAEDGTFYLQVRGEPESAFASIRAAVAEVEPRLPVELTTFATRIEQSLTNERMLAAVSSVLGTIALLLAVVGLYGVMSFVVTRRTPEIGLRLALGSTRAAAVWLVIRDAVVMIGAGTAVALPCVWALSRLVEAELFGVSALDGPTIALASTLLALVALAAAMLPAWRAASISPTDALRVE